MQPATSVVKSIYNDKMQTATSAVKSDMGTASCAHVRTAFRSTALQK